MKTKMLTYLVIAIMILPMVSIFAQAIEQPMETNINTRDIIYINGNSEFNTSNGVSSGSGVESDPYIIENWKIDGSFEFAPIINETVLVVTGEVWNFNLGYEYILNYTIWVDEGGAWWELDDYCTVNAITGEVTMDSWSLWSGLTIHAWFNYTTKFGGVGITIENTDAYCVIRNTEVFGCSYDGYNEGIYIRNSENIIIDNCDVYDNDVGIYVYESSRILIDNNYLINNGIFNPLPISTGIYVMNSNNITITNNEIYDDKSVSIHLYNSDYCDVKYNYIENSFKSGIKLSQSAYCDITANYVTNCLHGFYGNGAVGDGIEYCIVSNNTFRDNEEGGIYLINTENNTFYNNNLINNSKNIVEENYPVYNGGYYSNIWFNNYYDDYIGEDVDGDGIGDTSYNVKDYAQTTNTNTDSSPLMKIYVVVEETEEPLTFGKIITNILIGIMPVLIIILILKYIFGLFTNIGNNKNKKGGK